MPASNSEARKRHEARAATVDAMAQAVTRRQVNLLRSERDLYHRTICSLLTQATDGGRKTLDKADVAARLGRVRDEGNALFRRAKADR